MFAQDIKGICCAAVFSIIVFFPSALIARESKADGVYTVYEFDPPPSEANRSEESKESLKRFRESAERKKMLAEDRKLQLEERRQMKKNGYILVSEEEVNSMYYYLGDHADRKSAADIIPVLGFRSSVLVSSLDVVGVFGTPEKDGNFYDIISLINHDVLGDVIIEETKTGGEYGIRRMRSPTFDLSVNGNPAILRVLKFADEVILGQTILTILMPDKLMSIQLFIAVEEGGPYYESLFDFAHQL